MNAPHFCDSVFSTLLWLFLDSLFSIDAYDPWSTSRIVLDVLSDMLVGIPMRVVF